MNKKRILLSLAILVIVFSSCCVVSAGNLGDVNFNVSSEFKQVTDAEGLQFVDDENGIRIRIFDDMATKWESGFDKHNDTVYKYREVIGADSNPQKIISFDYGEYIKIDGKQYWVEIGNDRGAGEGADYDKILECLEYFNEHNSFEPVKI